MKTMVSLSNGKAGAGKVAFNVNGTKVGEAPLSSAGVATLPTTVKGGMTEVITTFIPSDPANVDPGAKGRATADVKNKSSSTALATKVTKTTIRSGKTTVTRYTLTSTAKVTSGGTAAAGKVTFTVAGKKLAAVTLVKGVASKTVSVAKGTTKVVASFTPTGPAPVASSSKTVTVTVR
jgi:hypothetical protein